MTLPPWTLVGAIKQAAESARRAHELHGSKMDRPMETAGLLAMLKTMPPRYMRRLVEAASQTELNALNRVLRAWLGMPPRLKRDPTRTGVHYLLVAYRNKAQRTPL